MQDDAARARSIQRRERLTILADFYHWEEGPDYSYDEVMHRLAGTPVERFIAISEDETYSFPSFHSWLADAEESLGESVGGSTGGNPVGVLDLDTWVMHPPVIRLTLGEPRDYTDTINPEMKTR